MTDPVMLLSQLHGEGSVTFRALRAAGFRTLSSIAEASVERLADRAHLGARMARRLKAGAEEMIGKGIGVEPQGAGGPGPVTGDLFSEGVTLDEASMLAQEAVAGAASRDEVRRAASAGRPRVREGSVGSPSAPGAAAASALPGRWAPPSRLRREEETKGRGRTFWAFG